MNVDQLHRELVGAGVSPATIVRLDAAATPEHLRYVDLLHRAKEAAPLPDAVVESSGQPFAYVVRNDRLGDQGAPSQARLREMVRTLACRSDARYLCVVSPGSMDVYPIAFAQDTPDKLVDVVNRTSPTWLELLSRSVSLESITTTRHSNELWLEDLLFRLLVDAARGLRKAAPLLSVQHTLSLVGRALFFRFLVDRGIVTEANLSDVCPSANAIDNVFIDSSCLITTCKWLDRTFNGDLLSLGNESYAELEHTCAGGMPQVCWHLSNIQHKTLGGQRELAWADIQIGRAHV